MLHRVMFHDQDWFSVYLVISNARRFRLNGRGEIATAGTCSYVVIKIVLSYITSTFSYRHDSSLKSFGCMRFSCNLNQGYYEIKTPHLGSQVSNSSYNTYGRSLQLANVKIRKTVVFVVSFGRYKKGLAS